MGRRIRVFEPHIVYSATVRCVERRFLLKPDHGPQSPLLALGCSRRTLDKSNKALPNPSVIDIIGASAARALELAPLQLHWLDANVNHLHIGFSARDDDQIADIPAFFRNLLSSIARRLNKKWGRKGGLWDGPYRVAACTDDRSAEQQLVYGVTNAVKDQLVGAVSVSPLFSSFGALGRGKTQQYFRVDWEAYFEAGGKRKKTHAPKDYLKWLDLSFSPLPHMMEWPEHRRRSWVRAQVREVEESVREERRRLGRGAVRSGALFELDPRGRPEGLEESGPQPLCHGSSAELRREYRRQWREVARAHRAASVDYRMGMWEREFPEGTFRPPITTAYLSSRL